MAEAIPNSSPFTGEEGARRAAMGRRGRALARAREMRSSPTDAEAALWRLLRNKRLEGWKFKRQQRIAPYIVDFVCFRARLIVEADGSQHADNGYDGRRDAWLESQGFHLLRLWNNEILTNSEGVLTAILVALEAAAGASSPVARSPSPQPLPRKGGGAFDGSSYG